MSDSQKGDAAVRDRRGRFAAGHPHRWAPGQSGNPSGRPKKIKNLKTVVHQEAYATIVIKEAGKKRTVTKVEALFKRFHCLVTGEDYEVVGGPDLGKLAVFSGVRDYPARVKCATLAWHTLRAALANGGKTVSTE